MGNIQHKDNNTIHTINSMNSINTVNAVNTSAPEPFTLLPRLRNSGVWGRQPGSPQVRQEKAPALLPWDAVKTMEDVRRQFGRIACAMDAGNLRGFERAYDEAVLDARRRFPEGSERAARVRVFLSGYGRR